MKIVCVIPAKLQSVRFPRKVLSLLGTKPMLQWVWEAAIESKRFDEIVFAIDNLETGQLIDSFEGKWLMTSSKCLSGTDRLIELQESGKIQGDIWVNWQGDEPFIHREMIEELLQNIKERDIDIYSLKKHISLKEMVTNPNIVKVVTDHKGHALYFSRSPIPYYRDHHHFDETMYYKHVGIYAFTQKALAKIAQLSPTPLELAEQLEQLRFLESGLTFQLHDTEHETLGIDVPENLIQALDYIIHRVP